MSDFERARENRIARNRAKLIALGLVTADGHMAFPLGVPKSRGIASGKSDTKLRDKSSKKDGGNGNDGDKDNNKCDDIPLRRSSRLKKMPAVSCELNAFDDVEGHNRSCGSRKRKRLPAAWRHENSNDKDNDNDNDNDNFNDQNNCNSNHNNGTSINSCGSSLSVIDVDLDSIIDKHLGCYIDPLGGTQHKAACMAIGNPGGSVPRFSRLSGVQKWRNAIMLFVNIDPNRPDDDRSYDNQFRRDPDSGDIEMSWFAQRKMHAESKVVLDLANSSTSVVMFSRVVGSRYVFLGRMRYITHFVNESPIRFVFALDDVHAMGQSDALLELLTAGGIDWN